MVGLGWLVGGFVQSMTENTNILWAESVLCAMPLLMMMTEYIKLTQFYSLHTICSVALSAVFCFVFLSAGVHKYFLFYLMLSIIRKLI